MTQKRIVGEFREDQPEDDFRDIIKSREDLQMGPP